MSRVQEAVRAAAWVLTALVAAREVSADAPYEALPTAVEVRVDPARPSPELCALADAVTILLAKENGLSVVDPRSSSALERQGHVSAAGGVVASAGTVAYLEQSGATVLVSLVRESGGALAGLGRVGLNRPVLASARTVADLVRDACLRPASAEGVTVAYYFDSDLPDSGRRAIVAWAGLAALSRLPNTVVLPRDRLTVVSRNTSRDLTPASAILGVRATVVQEEGVAGIALELGLHVPSGGLPRSRRHFLRDGADSVAGWTAAADWLRENLAEETQAPRAEAMARESRLLRERAAAHAGAGRAVERYHALKLLARLDATAQGDYDAALREHCAKPAANIPKGVWDAGVFGWAEDCAEAMLDRCSRAEDWYRIYPAGFADSQTDAIPALESVLAFESLTGREGRLAAVDRLVAARIARLRWYRRKGAIPASHGEDAAVLAHVWLVPGQDAGQATAAQFALAYTEAYLPANVDPRTPVAVLASAVEALSRAAGPDARAALAATLRRTRLAAVLEPDMPGLGRLLEEDATQDVLAKLRAFVAARNKAFKAIDDAEHERKFGRFRTRPKPDELRATPVLPACFAPIPPEFAQWFPERTASAVPEGVADPLGGNTP